MRLTKKREDGQYLKTIKSIDECMNKLGQYENNDEKLGIDYNTITQALENGIWVKTKLGIVQQLTVSLRKWQHTKTYCLYYRPYTHIWFKDYGKTWALTKEELTDGK